MNEKKLNIDLQNEKAELINKFNNLIKGKSKIDSEIVKQLYPEDKELYEKIKNMQDIYNINNLSEDDEKKEPEKNYKTEDHKARSASKKKKEEEIERKVEDFRRRLRNNISKDIENERINEARRTKEYEEASTIKDKKRVEVKNKGERKLFEQQMHDLTENVDQYVLDYKKKLMEEAGLY